MKRLFISLLLLSIVPFLKAQVSTNPTIVNANQSVTITFTADAASGLYNTTKEVYMYTGVLTSKSGSTWAYVVQSEWLDNNVKCRMTPTGTNTWSLTMPSGPRAFYGVPASEQINKIALIVRDENGVKGHTNDLFLSVVDNGLFFDLYPTQDTVINTNTSLKLEAITNPSQLCATINLLVNHSVVKAGTLKRAMNTTYTFSSAGKYVFAVEATSSTLGSTKDSVTITVYDQPTVEARPSGVKTGINIINDNTATFVLYAPGKTNVFLIGDFNNWQESSAYMLKKDGDYWWITLSNLEKGKEYAFQYLVNGMLKIADPYTDKILDPYNDPYIPGTVYPNLMKYPTGKTSGIVSIVQTGQTPYIWQVENFNSPAKEKLVIYELLIRDFTTSHSFNSASQKLDYLQTLGVNAIELMPVNEFEGNNSWGYNPSFYFAVDKYYGTKNDFKAFVDECHRRGIAVFMDLVLNHSYNQSPFAQLYWDSANNRPAANNPWYNATSPNTTYSWGNDFNHESLQTQQLVDSINSYWMNEYKVDGFRYDFTKGFTNKAGDGYAYDASRITLLKRMSTEIRKRKASAIVIFEHLAENSEEKELSDANILLWGNINYNYCNAIKGNTANSASELSWGIYQNRSWTKPNLVTYMESHDEERLMYEAKTNGLSNGVYTVKDPATALQRAGLSACFFLPLPGPKMIWQFGELGYDYSINTCSDGVTISNECRLSEKPVRWDYTENTDRMALYKVYSDLINLKKENALFTSGTLEKSLSGAQKYIVWKSPDLNAFAIGNFGLSSGTVTLMLPKTGKWFSILDDSSIDVTSLNYSIMLQPGEYHMYSDSKITLYSSIDQIAQNQSIPFIYPNPVENELTVNSAEPVKSLILYALDGQILMQNSFSKTMDLSSLSTGIYFVRIATNKTINLIKVAKK